MSKKTSGSTIDEAVSRSVDFELTVADMARRSERRAWWVAGGATLVSLILLGGYFFMLPLKEKVPYLVMADAYTGTSTVARLTDDVALQRVTSSEAINRSNVAHFVLARESYDLALTNLRDWTTVLTMASPDVASGYTGLYAALNPDNPYKIYGRNRAIRVHISSLSLIGGGEGLPPQGATVRFQRSIYDKNNGGTQPLDSKIATLAFTYKANLKMSEQQRIENPLGFQVTDYRVDTDFASAPPAPSPIVPKAQESASVTAADAETGGGAPAVPATPHNLAPAPMPATSSPAPQGARPR